MEKIDYGGWPNCIRLANGKVEVVATTDVGPRIIRFGFVGGQNVFHEWPAQLGKTGGAKWIPYGGHRFWHAPEVDPRTYVPDNSPVKYDWDGKTLKLIQPTEASTGMAKEIEVTLDSKTDHVTVLHRLTNRNVWEVEAACWAPTFMGQTGRAIWPQEPYRPHPDYLLPARPLVLWHYTDMSDPRWIWGTKYIQLKQDPKAKTKNKAGMMDTLGWVAYALKGDLFIKRFPYIPGATYPDFGCNTETFTDPDMTEVESLGPLTRIPPEGSVEHVEHWYLHKVDVSESEADIDKKVLPLVKEAEKAK